jgi:serine/threonine protein kinase
MMTTDLGACEWFVWDLRRSNLIDRGQLDQVIGEYLGKNPGAEPPALAEFLIQQGVLTEFQAERLLQGKTQGFVLGPFVLMDALGTGSMGTVYKAQSKTDSKWYAVKVLPRRSMWNVRIARRKVRAFEQCQNPSVVPFVDVGTSGGMHYLAWPMVEGETLEKIVAKHKQLTPQQTVAYAIQTAEGLDAAHQQGLFHGLLKPSNLMLGPDNVLRILDFGIGCLLAETEGESLVDTMSTANSVNSGLDCASPESIMDPTNLTAIGDQYSLGCCMYYCLTGQYPFPDGTAVEKMMCHQHKEPTSIKSLAPSTPDDLIAIVEKLMQKSPTDRYVKCAEVIEALRAFSSGAAPARRPTGQMLRPPAAKLQVGKPPSNGDVDSTSLGGARPPRPATTLPPATSRPRPQAPAKPSPAVPQAPAETVWAEQSPADCAPDAPQSYLQRIGPIGIVLLAVMAGAVAWLASSFIK